MDTNRLLKKRQLNVQEQNAITEHSLRKTALYWRKNGVPEAMVVLGKARNIDWDSSIILKLEIDFPGMPRLFGLLLSQNERFVRFEVDTDEQHRLPVEIEAWDDVTDEQNVLEHNQGIGAGYGALALKVLRELLVPNLIFDSDAYSRWSTRR
jgi:hypothetical protein